MLTTAEMEDIGWIKACLTRQFELMDLWKLETFLGLQIKRDRSNELLTVAQRNSIDRILNRDGMQDALRSLTPLDPNLPLSGPTCNEASVSADQDVSLELFQSAVWSLMYSMLGTRPDLAYAVGLVSQFNHSPEAEHWIAVKPIFCYLVWTTMFVIEYNTSNRSGGYSDADWWSENDRKSVGGYLFLLSGSAMSCARNKNQLPSPLQKANTLR